MWITLCDIMTIRCRDMYASFYLILGFVLVYLQACKHRTSLTFPCSCFWPFPDFRIVSVHIHTEPYRYIQPVGFTNQITWILYLGFWGTGRKTSWLPYIICSSSDSAESNKERIYGTFVSNISGFFFLLKLFAVNYRFS